LIFPFIAKNFYSLTKELQALSIESTSLQLVPVDNANTKATKFNEVLVVIKLTFAQGSFIKETNILYLNAIYDIIGRLRWIIG